MSGVSYKETRVVSASGLFIGNAGAKLFVLSTSGTGAYNYRITRSTMSTPWDLSTATQDAGQNVDTSVITNSGGPQGLWMSPDGTKVQIADSRANIVYYATMSTPWDLTTLTAAGSYAPTAGGSYASSAVAVSPDGGQLYVVDYSTPTMYGYGLATPWVISSGVTYTAGDALATPSTDNALYADPSGTRIFSSDLSNVQLYTMSTVNSISTATVTAGQTRVFTNTGLAGVFGLSFSDDGTHMYALLDKHDAAAGYSIPTVDQYLLTTAWDVTTAAYNIPVLADGAVSLAPTLSGTAVNHTHAADGAVSLVPTLSGIAVNRTHAADGAVSLVPTLSGIAVNRTHAADGAVSLVPTLSGTAVNRTHAADGAVSLVPTLSGIVTTLFMSAVVTMPVIINTGAITQATPSLITLPMLKGSAEGLSGAGTGVGAAVLPLLQAVAETGSSARLSLPPMAASASLISVGLAAGAARLPAITAAAVASDARNSSATQTLPGLRAKGIIANSAQFIGAATTPAMRARAEVATGNIASSNTQTPALTYGTLGGSLLSEGLLSAAGQVAALQAHGYLITARTGAFSGWSVNTENVRTSEYVNYDYLLLTNTFGKNVGVSAAGIYELVGNTDDAVPISADVLFGMDDFRTEDLKRVKAVYLGYRADNAGDINVQIAIDGGAPLREYVVQHVSSTNGAKRGRANIAKGLKARYWQYGVKNVAGADFLIDDMSIYVQQNNRKV